MLRYTTGPKCAQSYAAVRSSARRGRGVCAAMLSSGVFQRARSREATVVSILDAGGV